MMEQQTTLERQAMKKVRIADITNGKYFQGSKEEMRSGYLLTSLGEKISRVAVCGTVVERYDSGEGNFSSVTIDDGTDAIHVKAFNEGVNIVKNISPGELVVIMGRARSYGGENFIAPDIVKKQSDLNAETLWRLERLEEVADRKRILDKLKTLQSEMSFEEIVDYARQNIGLDEESVKFVLEGTKAEVDYKPKLLEILGKEDRGDGVEISKLLELSKLEESVAESTINDLMTQGMVYEPTVGKLRKI
jgi:RPA family protein